MPKRIECVDVRPLLVGDHPHFLEIKSERRQIFRNIADVLVLGAAGQDLATNHQERGCDNLFGSGHVGGRHDHPGRRITRDGQKMRRIPLPSTQPCHRGYAASSHLPGVASTPGRRTLRRVVGFGDFVIRPTTLGRSPPPLLRRLLELLCEGRIHLR
jgi:hypothetical protein